MLEVLFVMFLAPWLGSAVIYLIVLFAEAVISFPAELMRD